jgi:hypothetical protein
MRYGGYGSARSKERRCEEAASYGRARLTTARFSLLRALIAADRRASQDL